MKIKDSRDGRTFEGELVAILAANEAPSDGDVLEYYGCRPTDKHYRTIKQPCELPRMVLRRGEPSDHSYYILPRYDFYVEVKEKHGRHQN